MLEQIQQLLALLKQKKPPALLVIATVLSIVASVLVQLSGIAAQHSTTVVVQVPPHLAAKVAKLDLTAPGCPEPAQLGGCLSAGAPHPVLAGASSVRTIAGPKGPDVSAYQPNANFAQVKAAGYRFAFVKASEGRSYVNPYFARDWRSLRALHLPHGAYDFARPQPGWSGGDEARHFFAVVHAAGGFDSLPPVLDVEASVLGPPATHAWVGQFVAAIRALTKRPQVCIYTGAWFWDPHVGGGTFGTCLWVSGYANSPPLPHGWAHPTFWQFTDGGYGPYPHSVPGIGKVDVSVYLGHDLSALARTAPTKAERRAAALRKAKRAHRIVHRRIRLLCRGRNVNHHSAGCRLLFTANARLHRKWGKALR